MPISKTIRVEKELPAMVTFPSEKSRLELARYQLRYLVVGIDKRIT
jgi:hypothetical protein